jgi:hypothetical protein
MAVLFQVLGLSLAAVDQFVQPAISGRVTL